MSDELERLAHAAVPEVLEAALARAREQATARLADLLTDAIVTEALTAGVPAAASSPEVEPADDGQAFYAYGITAAGLPLPESVPALTTGARIDRVVAGDLALLVSTVRPAELRIDEDDLSESGRLATLARGHDAVVRAAALAGPVLPLRFGTVVPDEDAARRLLDQHAAAARRQLRRIGDTREWGVKLVRTLAEPVPAGPRPADRDGVSGTEYLSRRRQALHSQDSAERTSLEAAELLEEALHPHARETLRRGGSPGSSLVLDLALLVPPEQESALLAAAAELRERLEPDGLEVEVSGPWPPYSFAALEAGGA